MSKIDLNNLEVFRQILLNGEPIDGFLIDGEIVIDEEENLVNVCTFTLLNLDGAIPAVPVVPRRPDSAALSLVGQEIEVIGGYNVPNGFRTLFRGEIVNPSPEFPDDGNVRIRVEAKSFGHRMVSVQRTEVYPVLFRELERTTDDNDIKARVDTSGDVRQWAVKRSGVGITLTEIVKNIAIDAGYEEDNITIKTISQFNNKTADISWNGKDRELHQTNMSDWAFLRMLADEYGCKFWIDEDSQTFYFVHYDNLKNETTNLTDIDDTEVEGIHFYYVRRDITRNNYIAPSDQIRPWSSNTALPMLSVTYDFDVDSVQGGFIQQYTNLDGDLVLVSTTVDDDGKLGFEKLTLREEMLATPAADEFIRRYALGRVTWEDTKKFWRTQTTVVKDNAQPRYNPAIYRGPQLSFQTMGNIFMRVHSPYYVYNLGFGEGSVSNLDRQKFMLTKVTHTLGKNTYNVAISMRMW